MGWFDYVSDVYSSLSIQGAAADSGKIQDDMGKASGDFNSAKDQRGPQGLGTAQHRDATTRGGVSTKIPAAGTNEESESEKEANAQDKKSRESNEKGHVTGDESGKAAAGLVGSQNAGPHGGPVGKQSDDGDDEEEADADEEEDDEDDEPKDPKEQLEEECAKSQQCAPYKHHYDECVERVTDQQGQEGKAHEDCVEEFFHLAHCASQCAAPKLFKQLR